MNIVQALNQALMQEMEKDKSVILMGEDVGKDGGVFRVTEGLWTKFGDNRVIDTPLAESGIVGTAIGLSITGMKPVCEIQFDGFTPPIFNQLYSHATRMRNRTRGKYTTHIVVRFPYGGGVRALEHHSESPEVFFVHMPGIKVVVPATPYDAKGLLISAIRDPDPVIFMEPKKMYRAIKEDVPEESYTVPIGKAKTVQEGKDLTIFSYGAMLHTSLEAAKVVKSKYSIEVVDLRTLSPLDIPAIEDSVKKTGRVVIVHEAPKSCGLGAEIAAIINERKLLYLEAPIQRVTGFDTIIPLPKLEQYYFPNVERVTRAIEKVMTF
jgi:pyruvate dehydrogenase E1 component beta subunit